MRSRLVMIAAFMLVVGIASGQAAKQVRLNLRVSDNVGDAFISGAKIEIRDASAAIILATDACGTATVLVAPNSYTISVEAKGFKTSHPDAVDVESGKTLDFELEVAPSDIIDFGYEESCDCGPLHTEHPDLTATLEPVALQNLDQLPEIPSKKTRAHRRWWR